MISLYHEIYYVLILFYIAYSYCIYQVINHIKISQIIIWKEKSIYMQVYILSIYIYY